MSSEQIIHLFISVKNKVIVNLFSSNSGVFSSCRDWRKGGPWYQLHVGYDCVPDGNDGELATYKHIATCWLVDSYLTVRAYK